MITGGTTRSSPLTVQQPSSLSIGSSSSSIGHTPGTSSYRTRKSSHTLLPSESELINRLRREAAERTGASPLTILDNDDDGGDDISAASDGSRHRKRSTLLGRLDEDSALNSRAARRSISRELFSNVPGDVAARPLTSARPVTRRSVSRELQLDLLAPPPPSTSGRRSATDFSRSSRERSLGRDLEAAAGAGDSSSFGSRRSESLTRGGGMAGGGMTSTRPSLASQGRSLTQNEFGPGGRLSSQLSPLYSSGYGGDDEGSYLNTTKRYGPGGISGSRYASLEDRGRSDWRRVSVPERGKDFKSLPRKYNRYKTEFQKDCQLQVYSAFVGNVSKLSFSSSTFRSEISSPKSNL